MSVADNSEQVLKVELKGIEPISEGERHGRPSSIFTLWFGANVEFATLVTGGSAGLDQALPAGLAGIGDLSLTCSSEQSRNFSFGKALGEGRQPVAEENGPVVEGKVNAGAVVTLARRLGVDMPICKAVAGILRGRSIDETMSALMTADLHPEPLVAEDHIRIPHPAAPRRRELLSA